MSAAPSRTVVRAGEFRSGASMFRSLAASLGGLQGAVPEQGLAFRSFPALAPVGAVLDDPVGQRPFKADVVTGFFRFDPFVLKNLFAFGLKRSVKIGVLEELVRGHRVFSCF